MSKPDRLEMLDKMIAAKPDDPFPRYARAMELRSRGELSGASAAYAEVAERFPSYVPTYLMAAQVETELGRNGEARAWAERGLEAAQRGGDDHALSELRSFLGTLDGDAS